MVSLEERVRRERLLSKVENVLTSPVYGAIAVVVIGLILGLVYSHDNTLPAPYNVISSTIGWIYFTAWSISFYPQVYMNWKRCSVIGLSFDFELYNLLGFTAYSIFNCAFYWDPRAQEEYRKHHHGENNAVQVNDVFFSLHAAIITLVTLWQCLTYQRGDQWFSQPCLIFTSAAVVSAIVFGIIVKFGLVHADWVSYLSWLYVVSYIKLVVTLIKYIPQAYLNYERKSTSGWNIWNVLLDFTGGILSVAQLVLDASVRQDWSAVTGNPTKFALGNIGMIFDIIFMVQHYILYKEQSGVLEPLLSAKLNHV